MYMYIIHLQRRYENINIVLHHPSVVQRLETGKKHTLGKFASELHNTKLYKWIQYNCLYR